MDTMTRTDKFLAWTGLVFGGGLSIAGNLRAAYLPSLDSLDGADAWRDLPTHSPSGTSVVAAVAVPFAAVLLVEMLKRWTFLPTGVRRGAIGTVAFIAAAASWVHLFTVMLHEGNHPVIAAAVPLIPDVMAIVSAMALLSSVRPDMPSADTDMIARAWTPAPSMSELSADMDKLEPLTDTDKAVLSGTADTDTTPSPDTMDTDTLHALVPATRDMDTEPDKVTVPAPRRTARTDTGWRTLAAEALSLGYAPAEIAGAILENEPATWPSLEAGRKAVSRLR